MFNTNVKKIISFLIIASISISGFIVSMCRADADNTIQIVPISFASAYFGGDGSVFIIDSEGKLWGYVSDFENDGKLNLISNFPLATDVVQAIGDSEWASGGDGYSEANYVVLKTDGTVWHGNRNYNINKKPRLNKPPFR